MKPLKLGLIGTGGIAQTHMRALAKTDEIQVVAVCDLVEEKATRTAEKFGVPNVFVDYHDLLEMDEIEAVSVCTWNQAHCAPTVDALHAGKHVLCEKPMAATLKDATAMTKAVHETGLVFMVGVQPRFGYARKTAKAIVDSGAVGDIYYAEAVACRRCGIPETPSFLQKATGGIGTVADIGVYALDEALHLMGHPKPVAVSGIANNILGTTLTPVEGCWKWDPSKLENEDFGVASVRFENGALMTFKTSWIMHMDSLGGTLVLGTKGGLKMDPLTYFTHDYNRLVDITPQPGREDGDLFLAKNMAFAEAIWNGTPSPIPADEMLITNVIIQGLIDSAAAGHEVAVSVPDV